ncbi:MAG: response regulator [Oscillospiraceae bacterium]
MLRVLIADDEDIIRQGLEGLVEASGLDLSVVALAKDGKQALELARKFSPEIVLMDINMPFLNGLSAIEKIRELNFEAKIIIISGYSEFEYAQKAMSMGVYAYLLKPIDYRNFTEVLKGAAQAYLKRMSEIALLKMDSTEKETSQEVSTAAFEYIKDNFAESEISLAAVAEKFYISQSYLSKIVRQKTGDNFTNYINNLRIALATELLLTEDKGYSINEISELCGYSSQHYFSRAFKNSTGLSPVNYKAANRKG